MLPPENSSPKPQGKEKFSELRGAFDAFFSEKPIKGILQSMDELFTLSFSERSFPLEVQEADEHYLVTAKLPGISRQQIDIEMLKQSLIITVTHHAELEKKNDKTTSIHREQSLKKLSRTVSFHKPINEKDITANHKDGLLVIIIPKIKGKRISINE
ncbi:Hsp20/alpha crystallin family protein [Peribacillus deserti]|uniref:Heat-shock protein Hsp20 n=1 Tax=Peribacillus deserti TaxID=673318 RepID=A0A2N5M273_9BACI|nr:Hsp20/alpha crystallin family protein [Peribacillus deserti]PLT28373.1 heat-shock protein Hsp20 [Peribacillus deserti]